MSEVVCAHCGAANNADQRFCGACGAVLVEACRACGAENPGGFRFCGTCGTALSLGPLPTLSEERRHASVLFADLSGFTDYSGRTDPEDVQQMVDRCMRRLGEVVEQFGASSTRVIGDQLMAVFGAPVAHEDDAERAVRAGLQLQVVAEENRTEFGGLSLRVGINTGEVMFAPVGHDRSFTVIGDAVNVAARLQAAAPRGGVLVGEETVRTTARAIRYRTIEQLTLKGKPDPVFAALAIEPLVAPGEHPVSAAPMVGRDVELELLRTTWERVCSHRRPHLVTVMGPAGIGKTRLYHEFAAEVTGRGQRIVHGRSLPYGENTGYGAFSRQLKALACIAEADVAATAREKVAALLAKLLPSGLAATTAAHLAQMTGLSGEGAADKGVLLLSARRFFEALAAECPTVVVFEDLHWGDASLLDLVESLAARCRDAPLLLLVLARPELLQRRPGWAVSSPHTALALQDLSATESTRLVESLVRVADPAMVERLVERSGGNPLFLEELSASVAERLAETVADLPSGVKGTIAARLDALPPAERQLLLDASVLGKVFWTAPLRRLGDGADLAPLLESLEARDLIRRERRTGPEDDEGFGFKHALIQEVAYATLPRAARRKRHGVVARFLEDTTGDRGGQTASLLAYHWRQANEPEKAVQYLLVAADGAGRAWAKEEAVALLDEAVSLIPENDAARRRTIRLRAAIMRLEGADHAAAAAALDDLLPHLAGREKVEALIARARATHPLHDADGAVLYGRKAVNAAETEGLDDLLGPALAVLSAGVNLTGEPAEVLAVGERALAVWPAEQKTPELALCLGVTALQSYFLGHHDQAISQGRRGYELARELYHGDQLLFTAGPVALGLAGCGRPEEALAFLEPVVALGLEFGIILPFTARAVNILGGVLRDVHAFGEARARNEEGAELAARAAFPIAVVQSGVDILFVDLAVGDVGRAQAAWPALWEAAQGLKGFHQWLVSGRLEAARAEILLRCGDHESAADEATRALASATLRGRRKYEIVAGAVLAEALANLGRRADGIERARAAMAVADALGHPPSQWLAATTLSRLLAADGDEQGAEALRAGAREMVRGFAAGLSEQRRTVFLNSPSLAGVLDV